MFETRRQGGCLCPDSVPCPPAGGSVTWQCSCSKASRLLPAPCWHEGIATRNTPGRGKDPLKNQSVLLRQKSTSHRSTRVRRAGSLMNLHFSANLFVPAEISLCTESSKGNRSALFCFVFSGIHQRGLPGPSCQQE